MTWQHISVPLAKVLDDVATQMKKDRPGLLKSKRMVGDRS